MLQAKSKNNKTYKKHGGGKQLIPVLLAGIKQFKSAY